MGIYRKLKVNLPHNTAKPLLRIYPKKSSSTIDILAHQRSLTLFIIGSGNILVVQNSLMNKGNVLHPQSCDNSPALKNNLDK